MVWHIGCSGFYYRDWKEKFYPAELPQREWLPYYSQHFNTVEINATFYNFPKLQFLEGLYKKTGASFVFTIKAPRLITHYKKFSDCKSLLHDFYSVITEGLKEKTGCVLFQLPPSMIYSEEKLNQLIENMNPLFLNVIEFRHRSWWNEHVYSALGKNKICFCGISHPTLPDDVIVNTSFAYYRMHGSVRLYRSKYRMETLKRIADKIKENKDVKQVFIYFNNDYHAVGAENAKQLLEYVNDFGKVFS
jgi:uncharacterized protein YecE (DUF72 family)